MMPGHRIDCHAHVIDPGRFPFADGPGYRPKPHEAGPHRDYAAVLDRHGVSHALLVQPSGYGTDNSAMLDALARHPGRFKAIAVVGPDIEDAALHDLAAAGVVGVRFNLVSYRPDGLAGAQAERLLARVRDLGWHVQVYATDAQWAEVAPVLRRAGVRVLVDHFGVVDASVGTDGAGFQAVLALGRDGLAAVKLSAAFRVGDPAHLDRYGVALLAAFGPDRCVWGSDWPFLGVARTPTYAETLQVLERWLPDAEQRSRVLWRTPATLFGFDGGVS
jgi:predicted TIM-barrel fold metal-dependent hydrolase